MDIRIDGPHEKALLRLMLTYGEKTAVGMTRMLIREAAKQAGEWPTVEQDPEVTEAATEE